MSKPLSKQNKTELYHTAKNQQKRMLEYQAIQDKGRRQAPKTATQNENIVLPPSKRKKLVATARDQMRNIALVAWMVRRHVDWVSEFFPHITLPMESEAKKRLEVLLKRDAKKKNFDALRRHSRDEAMRIFEIHKVLGGDCGFLKTSEGMQGIEGDRIAWPDNAKDMPDGLTKDDAPMGIVYDSTGAYKEYILCKRNLRKLEFERLVPYEDMIWDGYSWRFDNGGRGVSPLSSALNTVQDLVESTEYALLKVKTHALIGLAITRDIQSTEEGDGFPTQEVATNDIDIDGNTQADNSYDFDFSGGAAILDMDPGDKVDTVESKTPSADTQKFWDLCIRIALLSLDIPYSFYDGAKVNFSSRIADRKEYLRSARSKQKKNSAVLTEYSDWKIEDWAQSDDILKQAMQAEGIDVMELQESVMWLPTATDWLDQLKQVQGAAAAVALGVDTISRIALERTGIPIDTIIEENSRVMKLAKDKGVPIVIGSPGSTSDTTVPPESDDGTEQTDETEEV